MLLLFCLLFFSQIQFSLAIIHCMHSLYIDCNFPKWMHYTLLAYATSFIILFTNFYIHAYVKGKRRGGAGNKRTTTIASQQANGFVRMGEEKKEL